MKWPNKVSAVQFHASSSPKQALAALLTMMAQSKPARRFSVRVTCTARANAKNACCQASDDLQRLQAVAGSQEGGEQGEQQE